MFVFDQKKKTYVRRMLLSFIRMSSTLQLYEKAFECVFFSFFRTSSTNKATTKKGSQKLSSCRERYRKVNYATPNFL